MEFMPETGNQLNHSPPPKKYRSSIATQKLGMLYSTNSPIVMKVSDHVR